MKNKLLILCFVLSFIVISCTPNKYNSDESDVQKTESKENAKNPQDDYLEIDYYKYYTVGKSNKTEENGYFANREVTFSAVFFVDEYGENRFAVQSEDGEIAECWFGYNESFLDLERFNSGDGIQIYGKTLDDCSLYINTLKPIDAPFDYPM